MSVSSTATGFIVCIGALEFCAAFIGELGVVRALWSWIGAACVGVLCGFIVGCGLGGIPGRRGGLGCG